MPSFFLWGSVFPDSAVYCGALMATTRKTTSKAGPMRRALDTQVKALEVGDAKAGVVALCRELADRLDRGLDVDVSREYRLALRLLEDGLDAGVGSSFEDLVAALAENDPEVVE